MRRSSGPASGVLKSGGIRARHMTSRFSEAKQREMRTTLIDGHSFLFGVPEYRTLHARDRAAAREELIRSARAYADATGTRVAIVFDGRGRRTTTEEDGGVQVFYSGSGVTADSVIERLVAKYAAAMDIRVVTDDRAEQQTVIAFGGSVVEALPFFEEMKCAQDDLRERLTPAKADTGPHAGAKTSDNRREPGFGSLRNLSFPGPVKKSKKKKQKR